MVVANLYQFTLPGSLSIYDLLLSRYLDRATKESTSSGNTISLFFPCNLLRILKVKNAIRCPRCTRLPKRSDSKSTRSSSVACSSSVNAERTRLLGKGFLGLPGRLFSVRLGSASSNSSSLSQGYRSFSVILSLSENQAIYISSEIQVP